MRRLCLWDEDPGNALRRAVRGTEPLPGRMPSPTVHTTLVIPKASEKFLLAGATFRTLSLVLESANWLGPDNWEQESGHGEHWKDGVSFPRLTKDHSQLRPLNFIFQLLVAVVQVSGTVFVASAVHLV